MVKLTNWSRGAAAGTMALLLMIGAPVQAADNPQVAAEIMALARAQWASEIAGRAHGAAERRRLRTTIPSSTATSRRCSSARRCRPAWARSRQRQGDVFRHAEWPRAGVRRYRDPHLQFRGTAARRGRQGHPSLAKSSRVYVRQGGKWMLVHANFAPRRRRPLIPEESRARARRGSPHFSVVDPCSGLLWVETGPKPLVPHMRGRRTCAFAQQPLSERIEVIKSRPLRFVSRTTAVPLQCDLPAE